MTNKAPTGCRFGEGYYLMIKFMADTLDAFFP